MYDEYREAINTFNMETEDTCLLSNAWKQAKTKQEKHKPGSKEFKLLGTFQNQVMKQIRRLRKHKSIEEMDEEIKEAEDVKDIN